MTYVQFVRKNIANIEFQSMKGMFNETVIRLFDDFVKYPDHCGTTVLRVCVITDDPKYQGLLVLLDGYHRREAFKLMYARNIVAVFNVSFWRLTLAEAKEKFLEYNKVHFELVGRSAAELQVEAFEKCLVSFGNHVRVNVCTMQELREDVLRDAVERLMRGCVNTDYPRQKLNELNAKMIRLPDNMVTKEFTGRLSTLQDMKFHAAVCDARSNRFMLGLFRSGKCLADAVLNPKVAMHNVTLESHELDQAWQLSNTARCCLCNKTSLTRFSAVFVLNVRAEDGGMYFANNLKPCCEPCKKMEHERLCVTTEIVEAQPQPMGCVAVPQPRKCDRSGIRQYLTPRRTPEQSAACDVVGAHGDGIDGGAVLELAIEFSAEWVWAPVERGATIQDMDEWCRKKRPLVSKSVRDILLRKACDTQGVHLVKHANKRFRTQSGEVRYVRKVWTCMPRAPLMSDDISA